LYNQTIQANLQLQIAEEKVRIEATRFNLGLRTPYLESQLRFAGLILDDAVSALRHAEKAPASHTAIWIDFAVINHQGATQRREKVQAVIDKYGGAANVIETGG
jgi:hypothetical protein